MLHFFCHHLIINCHPVSTLLLILVHFINCNRSHLGSRSHQYHQFSYAFNHCLNSNMMIFFASVIKPTGRHIILKNMNSLQYKISFPNPSSLSVSILTSHRPSPDLAPTPAPSLGTYPTGAPYRSCNCPIYQGQPCATGLHNDSTNLVLLTPLG